MQSVSPEVRDEIFGEFDVGVFLRIHQQDSNGTRCAHQRQSVLHCPARFATAVPGDQHILADPVWPATGIGQDQYRAAAREDHILWMVQSGGMVRGALPEKHEIGTMSPTCDINRSPTVTASSGTTPMR